MTLLETKSESVSSTPLNLSSLDEKSKSTLSFSELLKGVANTKDTEIIQKNGLTLSISSEEKDIKSVTKNSSLLSLLKNEELAADKSTESLEINPKLSNTLNIKELKLLITDAKNYLKSEILQSEGYKKSQIKDLPKTIKGLISSAEKLGIDVSKITLQEVQSLKTKEINNMVLFKIVSQAKHATEQLIQAKNFKVEEKNPKDKMKETLSLLLKGKSQVKKETSLTADFSVSTAKVIAPTVTIETKKTLEELLRGEDNSENKTSATSNSKIDGLNVHKADSFEVKLNEAKQMIKYLSSDVKTAIEDYKSPFTRIKVQLNPKNLGEVDLTIVQRGKNLHVNLSSNSVAINTLATNVNELKVQLSNSGINNATLNFSNQDSNNQNSGEQQKQHQAHEEYNYFENEEQSEEILSSLEIIVPRYV